MINAVNYHTFSGCSFKAKFPGNQHAGFEVRHYVPANMTNTKKLDKQELGKILVLKAYGLPEVFNSMTFAIGSYLKDNIEFDRFIHRYTDLSETFIELNELGKERELHQAIYSKEIDLLKKIGTKCYEYNALHIEKTDLDSYIETCVREYLSEK